MVTNTKFNSLLLSLTWCMGGSYTPIGLCWMLHRPWSACSLAFLTTKRFVWHYYCTTADYVNWLFFSVFLAPVPSGSELQSSAWCFPHRLLHCVYDLCGAEPLHLRHSGGIQSRADTSQGNSIMLSLKCLIIHVLEKVRSYHYRNSLPWLVIPCVIHITHFSYSLQKRRRLWTWCWWNSAVCLDSNVRNKVVTAWLRGRLFHLLQTMGSQRFLLGILMRVERFLYSQTEVFHYKNNMLCFSFCLP